jgi:hypothetical protein
MTTETLIESLPRAPMRRVRQLAPGPVSLRRGLGREVRALRALLALLVVLELLELRVWW